MKNIFLLHFFLLSLPVFADLKSEAIAIYPSNLPFGENQEGRISQILTDHKIKYWGNSTRGTTIEVTPYDADKARYYLAGAIVIEGLEITLTKPNSEKTGWIKITPYEALHIYKPRNTEQGAAANP